MAAPPTRLVHLISSSVWAIPLTEPSVVVLGTMTHLQYTTGSNVVSNYNQLTSVANS